MIVRLWGDPFNYDTPDEPPAPSPMESNVESASIDFDTVGGNFTGDTASTGTNLVTGLSGTCGDPFFGTPGNGGNPPYAGGTFAAQRLGFAVLRGFLARDGADANDFIPDWPPGQPAPAPAQ